MRSPRTTSAWCSSTVPAGSTGTIQRASISSSAMRGARAAGGDLAPSDAFDQDLDPATGREAGDQRRAGHPAAFLHGPRLAVALRLDLRGLDALRAEVVLHRLRTLLRELEVVVRRAEVVRVAFDLHAVQLEAPGAGDDLPIEVRARLG